MTEIASCAPRHWYVADLRCATDLHRLRERALPKEFDDVPWLHTQAHAVRLEVVRGGFRRAWQTVDDKAILAVDRAAP